MNMDSLQNTDWDVCIAGTGIHESLLALALSRSGLKILHVDKNDYYGSSAAALNLEEVEDWCSAIGEEDAYHSPFSLASTQVLLDAGSTDDSSSSSLGPSRRYSVNLTPAILPSRSALLSSVVSARIDKQLDFVAHGSTWLLKVSDEGHTPEVAASANDASTVSAAPALTKVPSSREDIFANTLDPRSKRTIIKFLRFVSDLDGEAQRNIWQSQVHQIFDQFLQTQFAIPPELRKPIHALTASLNSPSQTKTGWALRRIERHLKSMGFLGPGFGAVLPKWGGLAEVVQASCRAQAVGGGTYCLGHNIENIEETKEDGQHTLVLELKNGDKVETKWLAAGVDNIPQSKLSSIETTDICTQSVSIVSTAFPQLFAQTSENSPEPVSVLINVCGDSTQPPVQIIVHSSNTGECPTDQCILYAIVKQAAAFDILSRAVDTLIRTLEDDARVLWRLQYERRAIVSPPSSLSNTIIFPEPSLDLLFDDLTLDTVKVAWEKILGSEAEEGNFLQFPPRKGEEIAEDEVG